MVFSRADRSVFGRWWWTVDRWILGALIMIMIIGALLVMAASPAVAERIGLDGFYFVRRQMVYLPLSLCLMIGVSMLPPIAIRRLAVVALLGFMVLLLLTLFVGFEIKGATRWIRMGPLSIQPSEFIKPCFSVVTAWLFAAYVRDNQLPAKLLAIGFYIIIISLLLMQPDLGMSLLISMIWFGQFFLAGLSLFWVFSFIGAGLFGLGIAYSSFAHVQSRIDRFLDPSSGDSYQVEKSLEAFMAGGLFGRGPGEGMVKELIPDVHADFIFAVAGEEFGLIACLFIVGLFAFVIFRGFQKLLQEKDLFVVIAAAGLLAQFGLQALINIGSTIQLIPAKGMTLPFISYGGSSMLALALGMGMFLGLTRRRYH